MASDLLRITPRGMPIFRSILQFLWISFFCFGAQESLVILLKDRGNEVKNIDTIVYQLTKAVKEKTLTAETLKDLAEWTHRALLSTAPDRAEWLSRLESVWEILPEQQHKTFSTLLKERHKKYVMEKASQLNACETVCNLYRNSDLWHNHVNYSTPDFHRDPTSWDYAIQSVSLLFLEKAKPFCDAHNDSKTLDAAITLLDSLGAKVRKKSALQVHDMSALYGSQFHMLLLRDSLSQKTSPQPRLKESLTELENFHFKEIVKSRGRDAEKPLSEGASNSFFSTYAASTSILTMNDRSQELLRLLEEKLIPQKPLQLHYMFSVKSEASLRSSAARAVPFHLALYLKATDPQMKEVYRKNLQLAVENFVFQMSSLTGHLSRNMQHIGNDGLAPYYFYPAVPYVAASIKLLRMREKKGAGDPLPQDIEKELSSGILSLMGKDGLFLPQGEVLNKIIIEDDFDDSTVANLAAPKGANRLTTYRNSPSYANPLAGLALLPLLDHCPSMEKLPVSLGILDISLEEPLEKGKRHGEGASDSPQH